MTDSTSVPISSCENNTCSKPYTRLTFIDIPDPEAVRDREKVRTARTHAVTVGIARKRMRAQADGSNFHLYKFHSKKSNSNTKCTRDLSILIAPPLSRPVGLSSVDPFETLPVSARRLTTLLHLKSSLRAGEPLFNISDAIKYQSLQSTFDAGLSDGALTAALSVTLSCAARGWRMNKECIEFNSIAMQQLRQALSDPVTAVASATIGAILLLLGNAYRLRELESAKAHIVGLQTLLRLRSQRNIQMSPAIKRAIYWQDLFASIFLGTDRIVDFADFYPSQQLTIDYKDQDSCLPSGFIRSAHLLSGEFLDIAKHVVILYANRQKVYACGDPAENVERLETVQADLEGRLHTLRQATSDHMLLCCIIATQLCVYGFWDGVWNSALIPRELSAKLLYHLCSCPQYEFEDEDIFFWLVYVGKAFAIEEHIRIGLDNLWVQRRCNTGHSIFPPWHDAELILSEFIWSNVLYTEKNGWFWERIRE